MKILIVEDEQKLARVLKKGLQENNFTVDLSPDGEEGLHMAETYAYDALILDIMLPGRDGLSILSALRRKKIETPVLIVTARGEVEDRVKGLDLGADDYIAKPFDFTELLARLRALIRRSKGKASPIVEVGDLALDTSAKTVTRGGKDVSLSAREYALLEYLTLNAGRVVSRTELIEHVYDSAYEWDSNVIDVYINYLRNKIDKGFRKQLIHTVRGAGYVVKDEV